MEMAGTPAPFSQVASLRALSSTWRAHDEQAHVTSAPQQHRPPETLVGHYACCRILTLSPSHRLAGLVPTPYRRFMARSIATTRHVGLDELLDFVRPRHRLMLVTSRSDASIQISPVTGGVDADGRIVVSTYPDRAKTRNVARRPRVSVLVISDDWNGPWVQIDGSAVVLHMPEAAEGLVDYFRCISGEHPDWDEYAEAMRIQDKSLIRSPRALGPDRDRRISRCGGRPSRRMTGGSTRPAVGKHLPTRFQLQPRVATLEQYRDGKRSSPHRWVV